jgi:hypothetical protein
VFLTSHVRRRIYKEKKMLSRIRIWTKQAASSRALEKAA